MAALKRLLWEFLFLSTPSARRATSPALVSPWYWMNFYPRPPRGGRRIALITALIPALFLSTPSARRATDVAVLFVQFHTISIHALREEGDSEIPGLYAAKSKFLSTPSARRATDDPTVGAFGNIFLSTPSARRATRQLVRTIVDSKFLSTPSARRATLRLCA